MKFKISPYKIIKAVIHTFTGLSSTALQLKALKAAANAVVITDVDGKIKWVNDSFINLTGYKRDEAAGIKISSLVKSGKNEDNFYKELWDTILSGRKWKGICINRTKNGTLYFEEQTITPVSGKNGRIINFISIKEDITEKLSVEYALKESEKRLELFFQQSIYGFYFMMLDEPVRWDDNSDKEALLDYIFLHQKITHVNMALAGQYGGTIEQFIGLTPADFYKYNTSYSRKLWIEFFNSGRQHIETEERRFDGTKLFIEGDYICLYDDEGRITGNFAIQRDITDRKIAEEALRVKSEEMERFFTVALDLLCIADTDGHFIRINRAWERTLGYSIDELEGKSFLDFVHPDDLDSTKKSLSALSDQIPVLNFTNRFLTSEGDYRYIEWRSYPSGKNIYAAARDVTDRINYEEELNKLAERLTLATGSAGIGIWDWNILANELIWDHRMYQLYGMEREESSNVFGKWRRRVHPEDRKTLKSVFLEGIKGLEMFNATFRVVWPDGSLHHLEAHALVIRDKEGRAERVTGVARDITASKQMEEKLVTLSTTDPLTTAYNRRYLLHVLDSEISRAVRYNAVFSLIMFDIDHFKNVNDTYGHDAGDEVLKEITIMMQRRIRKNDVLARIGGEEFMILLSGTSLYNARIFADKLINELREMEFKRSGKVTASFGVTEYRLNETSDSVLKRADELVYMAKREGRNCIRFS